jgi:hypothetical protein
MKPTPIAAQRRQPTRSPRIGPESAAIEQRVAGEDRVAFHQPQKREGQHHHADLQRQQHPAPACSQGCSVRAARAMPPRLREASAMTKAAKNQ